MYQHPSGKRSMLRPGRQPGQPDLHGLRQRHWSLLMVITAYGPLHTGEVVTLLFGSRPAAVRHLTALVRAGLVWRYVHDDDPTHLAYYEASDSAVDALKQQLEGAGRPVPPGLGRASRAQPHARAMLLALTEGNGKPGGGHLYRWRRAADTAVWLRQHGVGPVDVAASGIWIERDTAVRFLLHIDPGTWYTATGTYTVPPSLTVNRYRHVTGIPATVVLVVCATPQREPALHAELTTHPVPVRVASTTWDRVAAHGADGAVWTLDGVTMRRLIDLAQP